MPSKKKIDFRVDENGCFIVTSHQFNKDGYSHFRIKGVDTRMHRFIYEECFGPIPEGLVVRHKCDVRSCINPEHLELGTHGENMIDRGTRGRVARGERNGRKVIDEATAIRIKRLIQSGEQSSNIARMFNIEYAIVWKIKAGITWKHLAI